jgi:hypothetical protein
MKAAIIGWLVLVAAPTFACDYPDEGGMPLRRAVTKVRMLPEVEAMARSGSDVRYLVKLDEPVKLKGICYWPVEVRSDGALWHRYLVSPDGKKILR